MRFNVRLVFINEPPNPRDEEEVIMYEMIDQMQKAYDRYKEQDNNPLEEITK